MRGCDADAPHVFARDRDGPDSRGIDGGVGATPGTGRPGKIDRGRGCGDRTGHRLVDGNQANSNRHVIRRCGLSLGGGLYPAHAQDAECKYASHVFSGSVTGGANVNGRLVAAGGGNISPIPGGGATDSEMFRQITPEPACRPIVGGSRQ